MKTLRYVLIIAIFISLVSTSEGQIDYYHFDGQRAEKLMFSAINRLRLEHKLPLFRRNPILKRVVTLHSLDMIERNFFSHINPDGESPRERATNLKVPYPVSENLGVLSSYGITLEGVVEELLQSLMDSPEHRSNLLNPDIREIGIAFAQDKDQKTNFMDITKIGDSKLGYGTVVVCQMFMKRGVRNVKPSPFPDKVEKGESFTVSGETYKDFDTVLIELEDTKNGGLLKISEIEVEERKFEDNLKFHHKGNYDLRISGHSYEDSLIYESEELVTFKLEVE